MFLAVDAAGHDPQVLPSVATALRHGLFVVNFSAIAFFDAASALHDPPVAVPLSTLFLHLGARVVLAVLGVRHQHLQRLRAAFPRSPFQLRLREQKLARRFARFGPGFFSVTAVLSLLPGLAARYFLTPAAVMPAPASVDRKLPADFLRDGILLFLRATGTSLRRASRRLLLHGA